MAFTFHTDPGHGWLQVTLFDVVCVGLSARDFSTYSYRHGQTLYLEDDVDAPKFIDAYERKFGTVPEFAERHTDGSSFILELLSL